MSSRDSSGFAEWLRAALVDAGKLDESSPKTEQTSEFVGLRRRGAWGPWHLDGELGVLYTDPHSHVGYRYAIDLGQCTSSAEVLDWICQIDSKDWGTEEENNATVAGLVSAFVALLHPQANLCSWGKSKRLTQRRVTELVVEYAKGERW